MSDFAGVGTVLDDPKAEAQALDDAAPPSAIADDQNAAGAALPPPPRTLPFPLDIVSPTEPTGSPQTTRRRTAVLAFGLPTAVVAAVVGGIALVTGAPSSPTYSPVPDALAPSVPDELLSHLVPVRSFALEENDQVITVTPRVSLEPGGGFLVADSRESQVRLYGDGGELRSYFGRKGRGPGEFTHVAAALRTTDGGILAVDMGGQVTQFDGEGGQALSTRQLPITPVHEGAAVDDSLVVFTGRRGNASDATLLHMWNRRSGELTRSFFQVPAHRAEMAGAYAFAGTSDVAVKGDTLAAVFALSDTLYLYNTLGEKIEQIPLPFERFRPVTPVPESGSDFREFQRWSESYSSVSQVYFAPDGGFLVEYYDLRGAEPAWRLLHLSRRGERLFESASARLMAVDQATGLMYFADPGSETLDRWVALRLRS